VESRIATAANERPVRQSKLRFENQSERTHGSCKARLAGEREAFDIRAILRHESEYSHDLRWVECVDTEQERAGRSRIRAFDRKHVSDKPEHCEFLPHWSDAAGNSKDNGSFRNLARAGRQCSVQSRHRTPHYSRGRKCWCSRRR